MGSKDEPIRSKDGVWSSADEPDVSVFDYEDYHSYLKDWIEAKRKRKTGFSFQVLANRAELKSRSFLRLVSLGERDLLHGTAIKLSHAMGHTKREAEFFLGLVGYNNATAPRERSLYLEKLEGFRKPLRKQILSAQQYDFFSKWYIIPIWELVARIPFGDDFGLLAKRLDPPVTLDEARHAVKVLLDLELIEPAGELYRQRSDNLHTRSDVVSKAIRAYQASTLELAQRALKVTPKEIRQINTLSLGLDAERWVKLKGLIQEFRQRMVDLTAEVGAIDRVYQVNLQAFPLTKIGEQVEAIGTVRAANEAKEINPSRTATIRRPSGS